MSDALVAVDAEGRVVYANAAFAALVGRAPGGAAGEPLFWSGDGDEPTHVVRLDGVLRPVTVQAMPVAAAGATVTAYRVRPREVRATPSGAAERLEASEMRALLSHVPGGVYRRRYGREWSTVYVSERFAEIVGRPIESLLEPDGLSFEALMAPDDVELVRETLRRAIAGDRPFELEYRLRRVDGSERWVHDRGAGVRDPRSGEVMWLDGVVFDITARKKAERTLAQYAADVDSARRTAEEAARTKTEFLAVMSHEIRTPLNAIVGMTGLLLERPLDEREQDYVETIRLSSDALLAVINDILDFSKIDAGRVELEAAPFEPRLCVEEALDLLAPRAAEKRLELLYAMDDSVPDLVVGDITRLRQILVNLISNAVKFTERGEIDVVVELVEQAEERLRLRFSVRDTGIGIPADERENLFEAFRQVDASHTRRFGGTGLGLAISRRLAELMGGSMWVESEVRVGSTFSFEVDLALPVEQPELRRADSLEKRKVLVVDDHALAGERLARRLRRWGLTAEYMPWGPGALDRVVKERYDVVLVDAEMSPTDGDAVIEAIHQALPHPPALVRLDPLRRRAATTTSDQLGPDLELTKPVREDALRRTLGRLFGSDSVLPTPTPMSGPLPNLRILVAEDNKVNQKVALRQLETLGLEADVVADGQEALDALSRVPYDVVLMDVQMPRMDGLEAVRRLRQMLPMTEQPYVIAVTANATREDEASCFAAGMDAYLSKPLRRSSLAEGLRLASGLLARRRADVLVLTQV
ncbi:MAG: response regulator [Myxococcales bacterium]|nr:response regulator [Myxococcales bacterium]